MARREVLLIVQSEFAQPRHGYAIRAYHWLKSLSNLPEVNLTLVHVGFQKRSAPEGVTLQAFYEYTPARLRGAACAIWGWLRGRPMQVSYLTPGHALKRDLGGSHFHKVVTVGVRGTGVLELVTYDELYVDLIDSVPEMYQTAIKHLKTGIQKWFYKLERGRLQRYDNDLARRAEATFLVSPHHVTWQKNETPEANIEWLPNGPGQKMSPPDSPKSYSRPYFLGPLDYRPNRDALTWFLDEVYEYLDHRPEFLVIGRNAPQALAKRLARTQGVEHIEYAEDLDATLRDHGVCVAPMISGGGQQNKVTEAMVSGRCVVMTPIVGRGIHGIEEGLHAEVLDGRQAWLDYWGQWTEHAVRRAGQGQAATTLSRHYRWEAFQTRVNQMLS